MFVRLYCYGVGLKWFLPNVLNMMSGLHGCKICAQINWAEFVQNLSWITSLPIHSFLYFSSKFNCLGRDVFVTRWKVTRWWESILFRKDPLLNTSLSSFSPSPKDFFFLLDQAPSTKYWLRSWFVSSCSIYHLIFLNSAVSCTHWKIRYSVDNCNSEHIILDYHHCYNFK